MNPQYAPSVFTGMQRLPHNISHSFAPTCSRSSCPKGTTQLSSDSFVSFPNILNI